MSAVGPSPFLYTVGLLAAQCTPDKHLGELQQEAKFDRFQQLGVEPHAMVVQGNPRVALLEHVDIGQRLLP